MMLSNLGNVVVFFFKQKTAYEMRISDWSSDVCSSDLLGDPALACSRAPRCAADYQAKVSGPLLDCIDLHVEVQAVTAADLRSAERRVGKECVSTCTSRWSPYH